DPQRRTPPAHASPRHGLKRAQVCRAEALEDPAPKPRGTPDLAPDATEHWSRSTGESSTTLALANAESHHAYADLYCGEFPTERGTLYVTPAASSCVSVSQVRSRALAGVNPGEGSRRWTDGSARAAPSLRPSEPRQLRRVPPFDTLLLLFAHNSTSTHGSPI